MEGRRGGRGRLGIFGLVGVSYWKRARKGEDGDREMEGEN